MDCIMVNVYDTLMCEVGACRNFTVKEKES